MNQITSDHLDIVIFDVEHGNCMFIQTPSGETMLVDCGHKEDFSPSEFIKNQGWIGQQGLNKLVITHHDGDHISDIKKVAEILAPSYYHTNHIPGSFIVKDDSPAVGSPKHEYIKIKNFPSVNPFIYNDINVTHFKNNFKTKEDGTADTNYHSVITFIEFGKFVICFPGDIDNEGIQTLFESSLSNNFLDLIRRTKVFVAPHHGRVNEEERRDDTYLSIILSEMKPDIIIASDKAIDEQNKNTVATDYYDGYVEDGIIFGKGTEFKKNRKVLTTRNDNTIHIKVEQLKDFDNENNYYLQLDAFRSKIDNHIEQAKKGKNGENS